MRGKGETLPINSGLVGESNFPGRRVLRCSILPWGVLLPDRSSNVGISSNVTITTPPLLTKHPLKNNNIGPPLPFTTRVIITPPLILGYKYEKLMEKKGVERFRKKLRLEGVREHQKSSSNESRGIHRERLLC